jgi:putative flippase GtrA
VNAATRKVGEQAGEPSRDHHAERRRFVRFVVTGGIAALANLGSRWLFSQAMVYAVAVSLAYLVGMGTAYLLARAYVFRPVGVAGARARTGEFMRFAMVNVVSFLVVLGVSVGLADWLLPVIGWRWHVEEVAHLAGVMSPIVLSYYAHKHFSFGTQTTA